MSAWAIRAPVRRALIGRDDVPEAAAEDHQADAIAAREVPRRHARRFVDGEIERRASRRTGPELGRRVEEHPHDVALLAFEFAHEQAPALRARLPRDAAERIAGVMIAELAELVPFTARSTRLARRGHQVAAAAARLHQVGGERARQHFDAVWIGEGERHLEEAARAVDLEREPVDAVLTDARAGDLYFDLQPSRRRDLAFGRLDLHVEL